MLTVAFLLGIGTGWYLFHPGGKLNKTQVAPPAAKPAVQPQQVPVAAPATQNQGQQATQPQPLNALPTVDKGTPVPLTFYNTLQKGNRELMGTGINQPKEGHGGASKPASPDQPDH